MMALPSIFGIMMACRVPRLVLGNGKVRASPVRDMRVMTGIFWATPRPLYFLRRLLLGLPPITTTNCRNSLFASGVNGLKAVRVVRLCRAIPFRAPNWFSHFPPCPPHIQPSVSGVQRPSFLARVNPNHLKTTYPRQRS